jgi:hypothetical protein
VVLFKVKKLIILILFFHILYGEIIEKITIAGNKNVSLEEIK